MFESFEYDGEWWLPIEPARRIHGTLEYSPNEGAKLTLKSSTIFGRSIKDSLADFPSRNVMKHDIILGRSFDARDITLYKCLEVSSSTTGDLQTVTFKVIVVFSGVHFSRVEDIKFDSISVSFSNLDQWSSFPAFETRVDSITRIPDKIMEFHVSDDLKISIVVQALLSRKVLEQAGFRRKTCIIIEPSIAKPLEEYWKILYHVQNLLSVCFMEPTIPLSVEGQSKSFYTRFQDSEIPERIGIFYQRIGVQPRKLIGLEMLFRLEEISENLGDILKNWFEKEDLLKTVYELYFGVLHSSGMYLQHRFLSLVIATESFHRHFHEGKYLNEGRYKEVYESLLAATPDQIDRDLRERLKYMLKFGNEFSLRKRLKKLYEKHEDKFSTFIENGDAFVENVVRNRNRLVHPEEEGESTGIVNADELYYLTEKIKMFLEICLLKEVGFSDENIDSLISWNARHQFQLYHL